MEEWLDDYIIQLEADTEPSADIIDYIATPPIRYILTGGVSYFRSCIGCSVSFPILQRCDAVGPAKELDVARLVIVSHSFTQLRSF